MKKFAAVLFMACMVSACDTNRNPSLQGVRLWDDNGCAFIVEDNLGQTKFVRRIDFSDKDTCKRPKAISK